MTFNQISSLIELAQRSNLNALIYGAEGVGKTSFCKALFPESIVVLPTELNDSNLAYLKSVFDTRKVVIFENITNENIPFLAPILNNRTVLGTQINNFIIITARMDLDLSGTLPIFFQNPSSVSWLAWAKENGIHPSIIKAIENKDLLDAHKPRDLQTLSNILNNNVPHELIDSVLTSFLKTDIESIELIKNNMLTLDSSESVANQAIENRGRISLEDEIPVDNEKSVEQLLFLRDILNDDNRQMELELLLEQKETKELIDSYLRRFI